MSKNSNKQRYDALQDWDRWMQNEYPNYKERKKKVVSNAELQRQKAVEAVKQGSAAIGLRSNKHALVATLKRKHRIFLL